MSLHTPTSPTKPSSSHPWVLADRALTILYGCSEIARLSHYFLPRVLLNHRHVLYLDGANQISPLLVARFARERGMEPAALNRLMRVARAFTCFQLTELIRRAPRLLETSPAEVLIITALPDLYFDEDVRDREARASFEHALEGLRDTTLRSLCVAIFTDATSFQTKRRDFFRKLRCQANHVVKVESSPDNQLSFIHEPSTPLLSA